MSNRSNFWRAPVPFRNLMQTQSRVWVRCSRCNQGHCARFESSRIIFRHFSAHGGKAKRRSVPCRTRGAIPFSRLELIYARIRATSIENLVRLCLKRNFLSPLKISRPHNKFHKAEVSTQRVAAARIFLPSSPGEFPPVTFSARVAEFR